MVNRLFQIVYLLMEKSSVTAKELAEKFEVSERTIYRDLDKLTIAGIPVYASRGKNGGISLMSNYVLDKSVLTSDEKTKILESLNALNEVGFDDERAEIEKLQSFFGEEIQDWIEIEFSSWSNSESDAEKFQQMKSSILHHNYMEITYSSNKQTKTTRKIKPLKLCFRDQAWYLYAYCCLRNDYRFFKLRRIIEIQLLDTHFEKEFVGKVLTNSMEQENKKLTPIHVVLNISSQMTFRAYDEFTDITVLENGDLQCELDVIDLNWFVGFLLSYGKYMRVVEPASVAEMMKKEINEMNKLY